MPDHYSHNVLQGIKWKLWIFSFYWYLVIWNWPSGLRAIASQSEAVFPKFQKCTYFATSEVVIFGNFFSNCCHTKTNRDKDMKPTANDYKYSKFLQEERSFLLSWITLELFKLKVWTYVHENFSDFASDPFPGLSTIPWPSSLPRSPRCHCFDSQFFVLSTTVGVSLI